MIKIFCQLVKAGRALCDSERYTKKSQAPGGAREVDKAYMSHHGSAPQCADPNCTQPSEPTVDNQCQKCQRPMHSTCGMALEDVSEEHGRTCSSCVETTPQANQGSRKAKRRRLNLSEKLRALDMVENGAALQDVADEFGSSKRAILRMRQEAEVIRGLSQAGASGAMKSRKQGNSQKYSALEAKIVAVLDVSRRNKIPISSELVRDCSRKVQEELLNNSQLSQEETKDLREFTPTDFWVRSFAKRHSIRVASSRLLHIPVSLSESPPTPECVSLKNELRRYDPDCIFTVREATMFHKVLPRESYLSSSSEQNHSGGSMKLFPPDMGLNDRLTVIFCASATGMMKMPIAIIGKCKQPPCFRIRPSPLPYLTQPYVWFNTATFKQWFNEVFIPSIRKHSWKNVALLVENDIDENIVHDPRGQIKILHLPPDSRTTHHPMEQGIMTLVKQRYRYAMLERVLELFPFRDAIQACNARKTEAFRGLDEGYDPNVLDVAELLCEIWQETSAQSIARSWVKTNILPDICNSSLIAKHGRSRAFDSGELLMESCNVQEKERIQRVNTTIRLHRGSNRQDSSNASSSLASVLGGLSDAKLETWLCLEERNEIRNALRCEAESTVLALGYATSLARNGAVTQETNGTEEGDGVSGQSQFLPSLAAIAELFVPLEELASVSETGDAAQHLRQAKRTLFAAKIKEMGPTAMHPFRSNSLPTALAPTHGTRSN